MPEANQSPDGKTLPPFASYTAKPSNDNKITIGEFLTFVDLVRQLDPTILQKPLDYIFDGEYQSGFEKILFEDMQIRLVDNG